MSDTQSTEELPTTGELERLQIEELRCRIRDLNSPWWHRPSITAPLATIIAAMVGLLWAIANGFFDMALRELSISKRELQVDIAELTAKRDRQSIEYRKTLAMHRARIDALDRPVIFDSSKHEVAPASAPARSAPDRLTEYRVQLTGVNLGVGQGTVEITHQVVCSNISVRDRATSNTAAGLSSVRFDAQYARNLIRRVESYSAFASIKSWSDTVVEVTINIDVPRTWLFSRLCYDELTFVLVRNDGRRSNPRRVALDGDRGSDKLVEKILQVRRATSR